MFRSITQIGCNLLNYSLFREFCRGDRIRTCDHLVPNQVRYRTALRPAIKMCCKDNAFFYIVQYRWQFAPRQFTVKLQYINWRDRDYLPTAIKSENYRKNFTQAVGKYVDGIPTYKYEQITNLIYKAVFRENAKEYREVLFLGSNFVVAESGL